MDLAKAVAKMRLHHHANMIEINNILNQLGLRKDDKAEEIAKRHTMLIVNDIIPRLKAD